VILPNKKEFIISLFSNGFQRPIDTGALSIFMEMLISRINYLNIGLPPKIYLNCQNSNNYTTSGNWKRETTAIDKLGSFYYTNSEVGNFSWNIELPEDGFYEISVYMPSSINNNIRSVHVVKHSIRSETISINQQLTSRWVSLGNYIFKKGFNRNLLTIVNSNVISSNSIVNAIKIEKYPNCQNINGYFCY
jgi:hypothetical protein